MQQITLLYRGVARIFKGGWGGHAVSHPGYLPDWYVHILAVFQLLQVTLFWMSSEIAAWINSVPRSIIYSILLANKEQEHGPLQMFGPANGVSNNLALEKIYCMLILRIRRFWPPELQGHKTTTLQRGDHGHPRITPQLCPCLHSFYYFF